MRARTQAAGQRFAVGTAQHTLQKNRLAALDVAAALLDGQVVEQSALQAARAPLLSLLSKSSKAITKLAPDRWQHKMLAANIAALEQVLPLLDAAME